jgi:hypothetical protein
MTRGSTPCQRLSNVHTASASMSVATTSAIASGRLRARWRARIAAASSATAAVTGTVSQPSTNSRAAASCAPPAAEGPTRTSAREVAARTRSASVAAAKALAAERWCPSSTESAAMATLASRTISCANPTGVGRGIRTGTQLDRLSRSRPEAGHVARPARLVRRARRAARDGRQCESAPPRWCRAPLQRTSTRGATPQGGRSSS